MASPVWQGRGLAVKQVSTVQVLTYDAATTYKLTIGGVTVSTIAAGSVNATATALKDAFVASAHVYFANGAVATAATDTVTMTASTAGVPFVVTSSVTGGTGTIGAVATPTVNAGPNVFTTAANWSTGVAPVAADTVIFANSGVDCLWGIDQSAVTFAEFRQYASFTGKIGLDGRKFITTVPAASDTTAPTYVNTAPEYRTIPLKMGATLCNLGLPSGLTAAAGSQRIIIDLGSVLSTVRIYSTAGSASEGAGFEPVRIVGTNASNTLVVENGKVGIGTDIPGQAATFLTVSVGKASTSPLLTSQAPILTLGSGLTLTTVNNGSGTINNLSANIVTLNLNGGTYIVVGVATHTTINSAPGSTFIHQSSGTVTTLNAAGVVDFSQDPTSKTVTTFNVYKGADINLDTGRINSVTITNNLVLQKDANLQNITLRLVSGQTLALS